MMAPARTLSTPTTGLEARNSSRTNAWDAPTPGIAAGYLQANLIVLPSKFAREFGILCARNPVPCPLLASSAKPGDFANFTSHIPGVADDKLAAELDIRHDISRYNVYSRGKLIEGNITNIESHWDLNDHVAFLIGCSFSFEDALSTAHLTPSHIIQHCNVPVYRTTLPLCPAGVFTGSTYLVSARFYRRSEIEAVRDITRAYVATHGEPIAWGWDSLEALGIEDINRPDWGDRPITGDGGAVLRKEEERKADGLIPAFWGCGVTPQEAVMKAKIPEIVMGHSAGYMLVLDVKEEDIIHKSEAVK